MKGEIVELVELIDDYNTSSYRVSILFKDEKPPFRLGDVEVEQK